jgi:DNA-binding MarR family transcriptional regulator
MYHSGVNRSAEGAESVADGSRGAVGDRCGAGDPLDATTALIHLSRLVQGVHERVSEHQGLPPVQGKLLCELVAGPRRMADLGRSFGVEKAALTGLVDRAERRGLVRRTAVPGDRRAVAVVLTDAGRRAAAAFHAEATAELGRLLAPLAPGTREQFRGAVADVIAACGGAPI